MTAKIHRAVHELLNSRLWTLDASPMPPVAWEGSKFDHTELTVGGVWLKPNIFYNDPDDRFLGDELPLLQGLYQVTVNQKQRDGSVAYDIALLTDLANDLTTHFARGTVLSSDDGALRIEPSPFISAPLVDEGVMSVPVTVPWVVRTTY